MGRFFSAVVLAIVLAIGAPGRPAQAYEYEHYALTYYLAVHIGYTERQAFQIASATFAVDWDANTSPMPWGNSDNALGLAAGSSDERFRRIWRDFHAFVPLDLVLGLRAEFATEEETETAYEQYRQAREAELWTMGMRLENIGVFMHYHQDREPHGGWADLFGHGPAVHLPDIPAVDPQAFLITAQNTVTALQRFHSEVCVSYDRDFCDRPLRAPDWARIETVLVRIMNANPVPDFDHERLLNDLKELSFTFDPVDDAAIQSIQHRSLLRCSVTTLCPGTLVQLIANAGGALSGVSEVLENNGLSDSLLTWFTGIPGPDDAPTFRVVVQALAEERAARASGWDAQLLERFTDLQLDMPLRWFQYSHLPDGRVIDARQSYAIEDRRYDVTPDIPEVTIEQITDSDGVDVFRVQLEVAVALENHALIDTDVFVLTSELSAPRPVYGKTDINLGYFLPAVLALDTNDDNPQIEWGIVGGESEITLTYEAHYLAEDWAGQTEAWGIVIHAYGLPTREIEIPFEFPALRQGCNSLVDSGGNEGGRFEIDLGEFTGTAGFSWEMFDVRDGMNVAVGGRRYTTGCVSDSGTFAVEVMAGDRLAVVEIVPNCDETSSTAWNFEFQCPLESDVTTDGQGAPLDGSQDPDPMTDTLSLPGGIPGQLYPGDDIQSAFGEAVLPSPLLPEPIGPSGVNVGETDDNDSVGSATPLPLGDAAVGTIHERGDADMFAVAFPMQGELTISFPQVPPEVDIAFRVLTSDGAQHAGWQVAPTAGATLSGQVDIGTPGDYIIEVRDGSNNAGSLSAYVMETSFIPTADTGEPNDTVHSATPLDWNTQVAANILPRGDGDYYAIHADRIGQLTVAFSDAPPEVDLYFRVLRPDSAQVSGWQGAPVAGAIYTGRVDLPAPGEYVIEVRDGSSNARSAAPYRMTASFDPAFDGSEPNDTLETATPLSFDTQVWANILPRGDGDYYRVILPHQGELTVNFTDSPPELDMYFRVLTTTGAQVWGWQGAGVAGETFAHWADIDDPGDYIIEVRDGSSNARSSLPYGMVASFRETADAAEPNDTVETATSLALGEVVMANILPRGDGDYYLLNLPDQGELTVNFSDSPAALDMYFRVLTTAGAQVWGWQGASVAGETFAHWVDIAAPGDYIIEVRDGSSNARAIEPYRMTASFIPTADTGVEPNNDTTEPTPVTYGIPVTGSILPRGDGDYYLVQVAGAGLRFSLLRSPGALDMYFRVLTVDGAQVAGWQGAATTGALFEAEIENLEPGAYVLEVRDGASNARSAEPYEFILSAQ